MFTLEPLTTSNLLTTIQIIVIILGFIFSWKSIKATQSNIEVATKNAQAQLFNQMAVQGRDLQFKFMDEYHANDQKIRQNIYTGTVIGYYAACFGLRNILNLPISATKLLDDELKQLIRQPTFRDKFEEIKDNFSREFIDHVNGLRGVK